MGHSRKDPHSPHGGNFCIHRVRGEQFVSDNSKCIRTSERGGGSTSNFFRGGGMNVFWNDPKVDNWSNIRIFNILLTKTKCCSPSLMLKWKSSL